MNTKDLKHTPGPWHISDEYTGIIEDSNGERVAAAYKDEPYNICDGHLIAAAPELLEALIYYRNELEIAINTYHDHISQIGQYKSADLNRNSDLAILTLADDVIAKATGKTRDKL